MPTLGGLIAAILAALAPSSAALQQAPTGVRAAVAAAPHVQVLHARPDQRTRTCSARGPNARSSGVERKLEPVACEQPPRSKVILTASGALDGLFGR